METSDVNIKICGQSVELIQDEDSGGRVGESVQTVKVETGDGGAQPYVVISTSRWALNEDEIDTFCDFLKQFIKDAAAKWWQ